MRKSYTFSILSDTLLHITLHYLIHSDEKKRAFENLHAWKKLLHGSIQYKIFSDVPVSLESSIYKMTLCNVAVKNANKKQYYKKNN
jgi:hypothetical protein